MTTNNNKPDAALQKLDRLVGEWEVSGSEISGRINYHWMEGKFFLVQGIDMVHSGHVVKGMEVIGREQVFGAEAPSEDIKSRFYGSEGETFDYVYELDGDTLTIWGGAKGSPAYFKGTFSDNSDTLSGEWVYPGGGYDSTATRIKK
jgi:hypothetical protein